MRKRGISLICGILLALGITLTVIAFFIPGKENTLLYTFAKKSAVSIDADLSDCDIIISRTESDTLSVRITDPSSKLISVREEGGKILITDSVSSIEILKNPFKLGYSGFSSIIFSLIRNDRPLVEIFIPSDTEISSFSLDLESSSAVTDIGKCAVFSAEAKDSDLEIKTIDTASGIFRTESSSLKLSLPFSEKEVSVLIEATECEITKNGKADTDLEASESALCDIFVFAKNSLISLDFGK